MLRIYLKGRDPIDLDVDEVKGGPKKIRLIDDDDRVRDTYLNPDEVQAIIPLHRIDQSGD